MLKTIFIGLMFSVASAGFAQENPLAGAIDIHVDVAPDSTPRSIDVIDLARVRALCVDGDVGLGE